MTGKGYKVRHLSWSEYANDKERPNGLPSSLLWKYDGYGPLVDAVAALQKDREYKKYRLGDISKVKVTWDGGAYKCLIDFGENGSYLWTDRGLRPPSEGLE